MTSFIDRLCSFLSGPEGIGDAARRDARLAIDDTVAVALAGWNEAPSRCVRVAYRGLEDPAFGQTQLAAEQEALIQATAAHALDYDDVQTTSVTHPSAVAVPALLALAARYPETRGRVVAAHAAGVAVNAALGEVLGFDHYDRGWHATATIGPVAGVSSLAVLLGFDSTRTRSALALAAAQAGGLQRNFGTLAKPVQAGFAAAAAVRAALLVTAGLAGDQDIFGARGYFELYGDEGARSRADSVAIEASPHLLSRKLYPCCYATHRMIGAAVEAHQMLEAVDLGEVQVRLEVPFGTMRPLRVADPADGNEAKFCAAYVAAVALARGTVGLADFTTEAISRPEIRALMERTEIIELPPEPGAAAAILDNGSISLDIVRKGQVVARVTRAAHPGSPAAPPTAEEMDAKIADCLAVHARSGGASITPAVFRERIGALLGTPAVDQATKARG